jgi:broad specificity phosphatase PhoE
MDQNLRWGSQIIQMLDRLDGRGNVVIMIRHSERPSFESIPHEQWDSVDLTDTGIEEARNFGEALVSQSKVNDLQVFGWGFQRCQTTAKAICEGASRQSNQIHKPTKITLKSPIVNHVEYKKALTTITWEKFIGDWLKDGVQQTAMLPAREYAEVLYRSLLRDDICQPSKTTVIATHDLFIIPLARYYFSKSSHYVDFLDGVVLQANHDHLSVGYNGEIRSVPRPESR